MIERSRKDKEREVRRSLDQGIKSLDIELHRILIPSLLRFFCQSSLDKGHERLLPRQEESDFPLCEGSEESRKRCDVIS